MNYQPLESSIEKKFVLEAKKLGCKTRKLNGPGNNDWPDRLVLVPGGTTLCIEFKRPGEKLSPTQQAWHEDVIKMSHRPHVCTSWQEAIILVKLAIRNS